MTFWKRLKIQWDSFFLKYEYAYNIQIFHKHSVRFLFFLQVCYDIPFKIVPMLVRPLTRYNIVSISLGKTHSAAITGESFCRLCQEICLGINSSYPDIPFYPQFYQFYWHILAMNNQTGIRSFLTCYIDVWIFFFVFFITSPLGRREMGGNAFLDT